MTKTYEVLTSNSHFWQIYLVGASNEAEARAYAEAAANEEFSEERALAAAFDDDVDVLPCWAYRVRERPDHDLVLGETVLVDAGRED